MTRNSPFAFCIMEIRQLKYFVEIVRHGSFGKAAKALILTQPALSRQIALLEQELGRELLIRGQQIELTGPGKEVFQAAVEVTDRIKELQLKLSKGSEIISGQYSISTGATVAACILPSVLTRLRSRYDVQFQILEGDFKTTLDALVSGAVDIGILTGPVERPGIYEQLFFQDRIVPVVSKNHHLARKRKVSLADIEKEDFALLHQGSAIRQQFDRNLRKRFSDFKPRVAMEFSSMESVLRTVGSGLGIGIMSSLFLSQDFRILPVAELQTKRDIFFCIRQARFDSLEPFMNEIRSLANLP